MSSLLNLFEQKLNERYINLIRPSAAEAAPYAQRVFDMLQQSYAKIGGIKGSGFRSPEDMVANIPIWKLSTDANGNIKAVAMYKDSSGRKRVAVATDGTDEGKRRLAAIMSDDYTGGKSSKGSASGPRAWSEVSDSSWGFIQRKLGLSPDDIKKLLIPPSEVSKLLGEPTPAVVDVNPDAIDQDDPYREFYYYRTIGSGQKIKIALGKAGLGVS